VFAVRDGRARLVPVEVGGRNGVHAWIRAGLDTGEAVIAYPPATVVDGTRVTARGR
jgi:HlyD family secretion protein